MYIGLLIVLLLDLYWTGLLLQRGSGPGSSVNSLQIALLALKERCTRQQRRIEDLESENRWECVELVVLF